MDNRDQVIFSVRVGYKSVEFEKGKGGIIVGAMEKLPLVIDTLTAATQAGELDNGLMPLKSGATKTKM